MSERETSLHSLPEYSRRTLLKAAGVIALSSTLGAFGAENIRMGRKDAFETRDMNQFDKGFRFVEQSDEIFHDLFAPEQYEHIPFSQERSNIPEVVYKGRFSVDTDNASIQFQLSSKPRDDVSVHPLVVSINNKKFLVPFIQTLRPSSTITEIGEYTRGEYAIEVVDKSPHHQSLARDTVAMQLVRVTGTPLQNFLRQSAPWFPVRPDLIHSLWKDILLMQWTKPFINGRKIKLENWMLFSSEKGGKTPRERDAEYGRTNDYESLLHELVLASDNEGYFLHGEKLAQVKGNDGHVWTAFTGVYIGDHPLIPIVHKNNISDADFTPRTDLVYAPGRNLLPYNIQDKDMQRFNREVTIIGYRQEQETPWWSSRWYPNAGKKARKELSLLKKNPHGKFPTYQNS